MTTASTQSPSIENWELPQNPIVFARHETFHPRFGWLKKGFDAVVQEPEIFLREDANVVLGVGKNMVQSIRYWCSAFKVLSDPSRRSESQNETEDKRSFQPTVLGEKLLGKQGWDPFLEDPASLWLLHWNLLQPPCYATAWYFTFNHFYQPEFSSEQLLAELKAYRNSHATHIADSSLEKDKSCILRMYTEQASKKEFTEETIDCPFTELGVIYSVGKSDRYVFRVGQKANLPAEIVVAACLYFADLTGKGQRTIALNKLLIEPNSPGMVFKLSQEALHHAIDRVAQWSDEIGISASAGLVQLSFDRDPSELYWDVLQQYYTVRREKSIL